MKRTEADEVANQLLEKLDGIDHQELLKRVDGVLDVGEENLAIVADKLPQLHDVEETLTEQNNDMKELINYTRDLQKRFDDQVEANVHLKYEMTRSIIDKAPSNDEKVKKQERTRSIDNALSNINVYE